MSAFLIIALIIVVCALYVASIVYCWLLIARFTGQKKGTQDSLYSDVRASPDEIARSWEGR